jgi:hypothetical protein
MTEQRTRPTTEVAPSRQADADGRMTKPIFIVGAAGSGTTLLRLILDSHPNIAIGPETAIMRLVLAHRWVPYYEHGNRWWRRLGLTEDEVERGLRDLYGGFFEHAARRQGKKRWGEKTPMHVWHIDQIAKVFDDAVFVGIIRHPAASIASTLTRFRFSMAMAVNWWIRMNRVLVHDGTALGDRLALARYEDLVADPEGVLRELLEWLEEPWSPTVLEHHRVQRDKGAPEVVDGRTRPGDAIDQRRASKWMTVFSEAQKNQIRRRTRRWAAFFGYDVDRPDPVEPFPPEGSPRRYVLTGKDLVARRDVFAARLDFSKPEPPLREQPFRELPPHIVQGRVQRERRFAFVKDRIPLPVRMRLNGLAQRMRQRAERRRRARS